MCCGRPTAKVNCLLHLLGQLQQVSWSIMTLAFWHVMSRAPAETHADTSGQSVQERMRLLEAQQDTDGEEIQTLRGQLMDLDAPEAAQFAPAQPHTAASSTWESDHPLLMMPESRAPDTLFSPCPYNCEL